MEAINTIYLKDLRSMLKEFSKKGKLYEMDFFPAETLGTPEGRFELLCLSIMDVRFNANRLWYEVAPKLREKAVLTIKNLNLSEDKEIKSQLIEAGYNRGKKYTLGFARNLKKVAMIISISPFNGDISCTFNKLRTHDIENLASVLKDLINLPGVGQKVGTMYLKFMVSTFGCWKWKGNRSALWEIALPNDIQVRKTVARLLGLMDAGNIMRDFIAVSRQLKLSFGLIDDVLWNVGRIFCDKSYPVCHYCILEPYCKYAKARKMHRFTDMERIDRVALAG